MYGRDRSLLDPHASESGNSREQPALDSDACRHGVIIAATYDIPAPLACGLRWRGWDRTAGGKSVLTLHLSGDGEEDLALLRHEVSPMRSGAPEPPLPATLVHRSGGLTIVP